MSNTPEYTRQVIDLRTVAGGCELTREITITDKTGRDISGLSIVMSVGTEDGPGTWFTPDQDDPGDTPASRVIQLLIGVGLRPVTGLYWVYWRLGDPPQAIERKTTLLLDITND